MKFAISFQYPSADTYPLFVRPDLVRTDGQPRGEGIRLAAFHGESALQVSRCSNHRNPEIDTAALKVTKGIEWLRTRYMLLCFSPALALPLGVGYDGAATVTGRSGRQSDSGDRYFASPNALGSISIATSVADRPPGGKVMKWRNRG